MFKIKGLRWRGSCTGVSARQPLSPKPRPWPNWILIFGLSILLSWGVVGLGDRSVAWGQTPSPEIGTVDAIPAALKGPERLYLQRCGTCHLAVPPQVLPVQTWQELINDRQHYGIPLNNLSLTDAAVIYDYLRNFSRPLNDEEAIPYRIGRSRYFRILHPGVQVPQPVSLSNCATCHVGASQYNFRSLSPEWQNRP